MLKRGKLFLNKLADAREKVARIAASFIVDGNVSFYLDYCV